MNFPGFRTPVARLFGFSVLPLAIACAPLVAFDEPPKKHENSQQQHPQQPPPQPHAQPQTPPPQQPHAQPQSQPAYHPPNNNPNTGRPPAYNPNNNPNNSPNDGRRTRNGTGGGTGSGIGSGTTNGTNNGTNNGTQGGANGGTPPSPRPGYQPNSTYPGRTNNPNGNNPNGNQPNNQPRYEPNGRSNTPNYNPNGGARPGYNPGGNNPGGNRPGFNPTNGLPSRGVDPRRLPPGQMVRNPNGTSTFRGANNTEARFGRDGAVREVRTRDAVIFHGPAGTRRVVVDRGDHRVVFASRSYGYVERPFTVRDHAYINRTYYVNGVSYSRAYRSYSYGGVVYAAYVPRVYYGPAFYGWAFSPWRTPVYYRWGWADSPWYGYYGGYFTPYPYYNSPALWLTDYIIAATLQDGYAQRSAAYQQGYADGSYGNGGPAGISPDVKQQIAEEVQRQLGQERNEGQAMSRDPNGDPGYGSAPPLFSDYNPHAFVVSTMLQVATSDGQECAITNGDVVGMNGAPPPNATSASLRVMASKIGDCPVGSFVTVSLVDVQEMQNMMRASIDQGLQDLQQHQGGLPAPPADAMRSQFTSSIASSAPPADPNVATELSTQDQQASQVEQDFVGQPNTLEPGSAGTVTLDQTPDQVVGILGQPNNIVDLGAKKIYVYKSLKVTFTNGRVSDVQ